MDLQQGCRLARIEEPLEMRERLADWRCFVHLAHKLSCSESRDRAEITASSEGRLWRPTSSDSSSPFATRLVLVFASWADENIRNPTSRICCFLSKIFFLAD